MGNCTTAGRISQLRRLLEGLYSGCNFITVSVSKYVQCSRHASKRFHTKTDRHAPSQHGNDKHPIYRRIPYISVSDGTPLFCHPNIHQRNAGQWRASLHRIAQIHKGSKCKPTPTPTPTSVLLSHIYKWPPLSKFNACANAPLDVVPPSHQNCSPKSRVSNIPLQTTTKHSSSPPTTSLHSSRPSPPPPLPSLPPS